MSRSAPRVAVCCVAALSALVGSIVLAGPAAAGKPCRTSCKDGSAPSVAISAPAAGSSVSGSVAVTGSSADNVAVASVAVAVDGGAWQNATGTAGWSWSWNTTGVANGSHTVAARATDTTGNATTVSRTVSVANPVPDTTVPSVSIAAPSAGSTVGGTVTVQGSAADNVSLARVDVSVDGAAWQPASGTSTWTWAWSTTSVADGTHTITARATDASGNTSTAQGSVTVSNAAPAPPPAPPADPNAPATQGSWVSPEGLTINVDSAGSWTIAQIYTLVKANALDLNAVAPSLTINVQDSYGSQTQTSATYYLGKYSNVKSTMWLQGVGSNFANTPDTVLAHEYGHAWSNYWYYVAHQGSWAGYLTARWTAADGSMTLATDSRTGSSYSWTVREIIADDYRLLFGTAAAIAGRPGHLNFQIPDPRNVPGLATALLDWRSP